MKNCLKLLWDQSGLPCVFIKCLIFCSHCNMKTFVWTLNPLPHTRWAEPPAVFRQARTQKTVVIIVRQNTRQNAKFEQLKICFGSPWTVGSETVSLCVRELQNSRAHSARRSSVSHSRSFVCWLQYRKACIIPESRATGGSVHTVSSLQVSAAASHTFSLEHLISLI